MPTDKYWDAFENIVNKVGGRPHWAKVGRQQKSSTPSAHLKHCRSCKPTNSTVALNDKIERFICRQPSEGEFIIPGFLV